MASDRLRVEDEEILERAGNLEQAIANYRALGENPLEASLDSLDGMNSSFTERIGRMLRALTDTNPDFLESLENIQETAADIANNLREVDTEIAGGMGGQ